MKPGHLIAALVLALLIPAAPASAQKLMAGKWTGTVAPPGEDILSVSYDVKVSGDTISISMDAAPHGTFAFADVKVVDGTMTFNLTTGQRIDCTLKVREDGAWEGDCGTAGESGTGKMVMIPPKK